MAGCSLCGSVSSVPIGHKGPWCYVRCADCGLVRLDPHPTDAQIDAFYANYVYAQRVTSPHAKAWRYAMKVRVLKALAPGSRFLDLGCNVGAAVAAAQRQGCESCGIDVSPAAIEHARALWPDCTFYNETIEQFAARQLKFDMVFCTEVIEHVRDLHAFMRALVAVLNPRAAVFFTTPDAGHWRVPKDLLRWKEMRPPQHLALFNRGNISRLFEQHRLRPLFFYPMHRANLRFYARYEGAA